MKGFLRLLFWINWVLIFFTVIGYSASFLDPTIALFPQVVGLFMPWLLLANILFVLFWLSMRKKWILYSLICLLLGIGQITRFTGFHFNPEVAPSQISLLSFNSQSHRNLDEVNAVFMGITKKYSLDFLCLQEISGRHIESIKKNLGLQHHYYYKGRAIITRYAIETQGNIQFDKSVNGCIWVDVNRNGQKFRIYNLHLKSNRVTREAEKMIDNMSKDRSRALSNIVHMVRNYQDACTVRNKQVDKIIRHVLESPYPRIVAGDFNDTPFSHVYQQFSNNFVDHFKKKGLGVGSTYAGSLPGLKIDYIFADEIFKPLDHRILKTEISDHFPVVSLMKVEI